MMTYKSGRFWVGKTSFVLPEGSLIDSDYPVDPFFGFVLHPPDMSYRIEFQFCPEDGDARQSMEKDLSELSKKPVIRRVKYSCGEGWATMYSTCRNKCYDLRFDIPPVEIENGHVLNMLNILTYVDTAVNMEDVLQGEYFQALINGIQI